MRPIHLLTACLMISTLDAQQVDWLTSSALDYDLNPGMPRHTIASVPSHVVGMRTASVSTTSGPALFGTVVLEQFDPATGDTWLSCMLTDSVSIGSAVVDPAGIAYFSGSFMGDALVFCDGSQLAGLEDGMGVNYFVMAWSLNTGQPLWSRNLGLNVTNAAPALALDAGGRLWYSAIEFNGGRIAQVDGLGNDVVVRSIDNMRRFGTISFDPWGGMYVSGSCENGTLTFGGQGFPVESAEGYNMFVLRYRPDGSVGFAEFGVDITFTDPTVAATSDGHAYLAGALNLNGEIWDGVHFEGAEWGDEVFIMKLDSTGQFLWAREGHPAGSGITGDVGRGLGPCITVDGENNVYFIGSTRGEVEWTGGVVSGGPGLTQRRLTVVAFDPDGIAQWAASSAPGPWFVTGQSITCIAGSNTVHFVGHVSEELTFPPFTVNSGGGQAAVFGRINVLSTGLAEAPAPGTITVWPNPVADVLFVEVEATVVLPAELFNSAGQRLLNITLQPGRNTVIMSGLAPGLYLLRAVDGSRVRVVKE